MVNTEWAMVVIHNFAENTCGLCTYYQDCANCPVYLATGKRACMGTTTAMFKLLERGVITFNTDTGEYELCVTEE